MQITSSYMIRSFSTSETCANGISYYLWLFWLFSCVCVCACIAFSVTYTYAPPKRGKVLLYTFCWNHSSAKVELAFKWNNKGWKIISIVLCMCVIGKSFDSHSSISLRDGKYKFEWVIWVRFQFPSLLRWNNTQRRLEIGWNFLNKAVDINVTNQINMFNVLFYAFALAIRTRTIFLLFGSSMVFIHVPWIIVVFVFFLLWAAAVVVLVVAG